MKRDTWKQPTPIMQLWALTMSIEGNASVYKQGIISAEIYAERAAESALELQELVPFVEQGGWDLEEFRRVWGEGFVVGVNSENELNGRDTVEIDPAIMVEAHLERLKRFMSRGVRDLNVVWRDGFMIGVKAERARLK